MDQELISYLDKRFGETTRQIREDFRTEIREQVTTVHRHFDVVAEDMRTHIQIVAEGVSSISERLDRAEQNLREEILCSQRELGAMIKFSYTELDRRIVQLEASTRNLEARVTRLETART